MTQINNPPAFVNDYLRALKPAVVRWSMPGWGWPIHDPETVVAGIIHFCPIFVPERTTYDRIGIYITVGDGAGGQADLRIFNWDGGIPTSLILNAGVVPTNIGPAAEEIVINQTFERGYYFLASRFDQAPTVAGIKRDDLWKCPVQGRGVLNGLEDFAHCICLVTAVYSDPAPVITGMVDSSRAFVRLREA